MRIVLKEHTRLLCQCGCGVLRTADETLDLAKLTEREREVLLALGTGSPNRLVARRLGIAERTVKGHVASLVSKLGLVSRVEVVAVAILHHQRICTEDPAPLPKVP
ncbi:MULTISPECIES: LuxR C-terminal-related transcriptional regulator [unclassified Streptomyces]|uniref:LuxR C-terminal-related transcriptional regulator n=1 Tax=unclassified Streptomyces TaxID=2593676 RepID=UPI00201F71AA|nr:LuxR C-terminal-related transcriptional regulator [Streptomyces sp. 35G-GA-8]MCL7378770.1 LuxR C-terminal-related transcriptional regulator [Streptomyces sp. 35G-GA-8]